MSKAFSIFIFSLLNGNIAGCSRKSSRDAVILHRERKFHDRTFQLFAWQSIFLDGILDFSILISIGSGKLHPRAGIFSAARERQDGYEGQFARSPGKRKTKTTSCIQTVPHWQQEAEQKERWQWQGNWSRWQDDCRACSHDPIRASNASNESIVHFSVTEWKSQANKFIGRATRATPPEWAVWDRWQMSFDRHSNKCVHSWETYLRHEPCEYHGRLAWTGCENTEKRACSLRERLSSSEAKHPLIHSWILKWR